MSENVTINLNGKDVTVPAGITIRKAAEMQGIEIPTFCFDERLKPFSSCFLCVVDVEGARSMTPSCSTQVAEGMKIKTDSQKVMDSRKMNLDLILSDHAGDCIAPCEATCPSNVDIQGYIAHVANGNFEAATKLIKERNPLPVVCGRICPHPCESQCRRALVDEAVAINPIKRFASEYELAKGPYLPPCAPDTGKRVDIVGGGPAGLTAAYFLRQFGHEVHIHEGLPALGGMARYGIPAFRLPWDMMDAEIGGIIDLGVKVHHGRWLGKDFTIEDLKKDGADAVLIAIGAHKSKAMWVDNEDADGVIGGIDFLREVVLGNDTGIGEGAHVAVIGGGDTAMDCCRVALRKGAKVTLLYRRTQEEMPALPLEQHETMEEGVEFRFLTAPTAVAVDDNNRAIGLKVVTMELGEPDSSGRRRPVPIEGSEEVLPFTHIIPAIGQDPDITCLDSSAAKPETTKWKTLVYDQSNMATSVEGVFTAGDCAWGPETVIRAIGEGKQSAKAMHRFLNGEEVKLERPYEISRGRNEDLDMADFSPRYEHQKRNHETTFEPEKRLADGGYAPINRGFDEIQVLAEASRCIECGCNARFGCDLRDYATDYGASDKVLVGQKRNYEEDKRHPFIKIEADKCITCGSCVRMCDEVRDISALTFVHRGFATKITPNFEDPLQTVGCDACGMCIDVCPTGAMAANTGKEVGPWFTYNSVTTCTSCARGCALRVSVRDGLITNVASVVEDPANGAVICLEGRFALQLRDSVTGALSQLDLSQLEQAKSMVAGAASVAVLTTAATTVENLFAAKKLAESKGGKLYYSSEAPRESSKKPHAKAQGQQNLALLKRLGAQAWDNPSVDLLVSVGQAAPNPQAKQTLLLSNHESAADLRLPLADPLRSAGAFLNDQGQLALLNSPLPVADEQQGYALLAELAGLGALKELSALRQALAGEVSEMAPLTNGLKGRLVATGLAPELASVAMDSREAAFAAFVAAKGL
ncbi:MAG: FAD-dependent oxidoreductase [bacterium]|nr:FAD-dependent oxidoreductase [bacterium]